MSSFLSGVRARPYILAGLVLTLSWLVLYLFTVSPTVNFIDSGELITAAYEPGIAHPPGYPVYVLMGYVATNLLWGEVAWRLNVLSAFWAAMCVGAVFFLILRMASYIEWSRAHQVSPALKQKRGSRPVRRDEPGSTPASPVYSIWQVAAAAGSASLLGASASFWSRSAQAKMYSLHFFFVALLFWLALHYRWSHERRDAACARRWLVGLVITGSFSFTNHLMTNLLVPGLALMFLYGDGWVERGRSFFREWRVIIPSLLPLLLYLYLPVRMAQGPYMNWGSPDNWGDFWRHVTVWQYRAYWLKDVSSNILLIRTYSTEQWGLLTLPVLIASVAAAIYFFRLHRRLFVATFVTAAITFAFSVGYSISEIEPYLIPIYMMMVLWTGVAAVAAFPPVGEVSSRSGHSIVETRRAVGRGAQPIPVIIGIAALAALIMQYPLQDRSSDRMAPALVNNVFSGMPQNSILITDYWDFYAPTYYLQRVQQVRPDITVIDSSLLKYPWYTEQLRKSAPELIAKSSDIIGPFALEQRRWVDGVPYNSQLLNNLYTGLLTSFVERNPDRRSFVLFNAPCNQPQAPEGCEGGLIAPKYSRLPAGLAFELIPPSTTPVPPVFPEYDLSGITTKRIKFDDAALRVAQHYATTYRQLSQLYRAYNMPESSRQATVRAEDIEKALAVK